MGERERETYSVYSSDFFRLVIFILLIPRSPFIDIPDIPLIIPFVSESSLVLCAWLYNRSKMSFIERARERERAEVVDLRACHRQCRSCNTCRSTCLDWSSSLPSCYNWNQVGRGDQRERGGGESHWCATVSDVLSVWLVCGREREAEFANQVWKREKREPLSLCRRNDSIRT